MKTDEPDEDGVEDGTDPGAHETIMEPEPRIGT